MINFISNYCRNQDLSQPRFEANLPDGLLSVPLFRHQKIALAWMHQRESRTFCVGGILADDQGLGKTISTIALIQMQRSLQLKAKSEERRNHNSETYNLDDDDDNHNTEGLTVLDDDDISVVDPQNVLENEGFDRMKRRKKASSSSQVSNQKRQAAGTLIVCPATVLRQWARELVDKVADEETLIDGKPIISLPPKLIEMERVNFSTEERSFYAQLEADSRSQFKAYAAAGTVNQNYANILLLLLRLRQACDHPLLAQGFSSNLARKTSIEVAKKLSNSELMKLLDHLETLPICRACSDPPEDAVVTICGHVFCYQCVSDYCTSDENTCPVPSCREQLSADVVFSEPTLRSCLSKHTDHGTRTDDQHDKSSSILKTKYHSSKIRAALEILQSLCQLSGPFLDVDSSAGCNGNFSYLGEVAACDASLSVHVRTEVKVESSLQGPKKAIVFSQWTRMLDLFERALNESCIRYRRLDGTMSLASRDRAVREFNTNPEVTVMLMSLKAGNLGLNMVAACHVILLDLWWNPTTEDQAIDRAHRIGQTRPVRVSRITVKDTVEDRILALQEEKRKIVASAFGEDHSGGSASHLTVDDLRYLFMGGS